MAEINSARLRNALAKTVGPSPWYSSTFPAFRIEGRQGLIWRHHDEGSIANLVTLNFDDKPDQPLLALNAYCRPFEIGESQAGVWCPEGRGIRIVCFDLPALKTFDIAEIAGWFKQSSDRIYAATAPAAEFEVPLGMTAGMHNIEVPAELRVVDELIVPTSHPAKRDDDPAYALYVVYPHAGLVEVLPQRWFTKSQYEVGRQWITKAARDGESHRIFGECFGAGIFLLEEDGCRIERWIDKSA